MPITGRSFLISSSVHLGLILTLLAVHTAVKPRATVHEKRITLYVASKMKFPVTTPQQGGGGGGGRDPLPASRGQLPKPTPKPFVAPSVNTPPARLQLPASLLLPPDVELPRIDLPRYGDPLSSSLIPSDGPGQNGGIGTGRNGGVGPREGPGAGDGDGPGLAGSFPAGATQPILLYRVEPEYSEEARKARYQGTVLLMAEVDVTGKPRRIRVVRELGLGLDEKAVEAVARWKFRPGRKGGRPVPVPGLHRGALPAALAEAAQDPCRQSYDRPDQLQRAFHGDADQAERQQYQPGQRVKDQGQKGQRPAQNQQDQPQQKLDHQPKSTQNHAPVFLLP